MFITYVFGCVEAPGADIKTLSVQALLRGKEQHEEARKRARAKAEEATATAGYGKPQLLAEIGTPDIRIVLEGGCVSAIFFRNTDPAPSFSVSDLDYSDDPDKEGDRLLVELAEQGFVSTPFFVGT